MRSLLFYTRLGVTTTPCVLRTASTMPGSNRAFADAWMLHTVPCGILAPLPLTHTKLDLEFRVAFSCRRFLYAVTHLNTLSSVTPGTWPSLSGRSCLIITPLSQTFTPSSSMSMMATPMYGILSPFAADKSSHWSVLTKRVPLPVPLRKIFQGGTRFFPGPLHPP